MPVESPPWNRQRRFPGTTLMTQGAPARRSTSAGICALTEALCSTGRTLASCDTSAVADMLLQSMHVPFWGSGQ
jgi:hypothetical protein